MMNKYRVHEVAKDLKLNTKEITEILTKYSQTPKNHMQVLEDRELAIIFDYVTQKNQIDSIESVFADTYHEPKPAAAPKAEKQAAPAQKPVQNNQKQAAPAQQNNVQKPVSRVPEKKVVDTRGAGNVNLDKYDERLENFTSERQQAGGGKQKFQGRNAQRQRGGKQAGSFGNKRKQEEQERMRRLLDQMKQEG